MILKRINENKMRFFVPKIIDYFLYYKHFSFFSIFFVIFTLFEVYYSRNHARIHIRVQYIFNYFLCQIFFQIGQNHWALFSRQNDFEEGLWCEENAYFRACFRLKKPTLPYPKNIKTKKGKNIKS